MKKIYLWHLAGSAWDRVMERVENGATNSFKKAHEVFLRKRKAGRAGKTVKKIG